MFRKSLSVIILILFFGLLMSGCPKKTVMKEETSLKKVDESAADREKVIRLEAERTLRGKELKIKEEEAKRALAEKELADLGIEDARTDNVGR